MTQTLQQLGYNEYLDRTIGLNDDPLAGAVKLDTVGSRFTGVTGFSDVIDPILLTEGALSVGKTAYLQDDGTIDEGMTRGQFTGFTPDQTIIPNDIVNINPGNGYLVKATLSTGTIGFANDASTDNIVVVKTGPVARNITTHVNSQRPNGTVLNNYTVLVNSTTTGGQTTPGEWRTSQRQITTPMYRYGGDYLAPIGYGLTSTTGGSCIRMCYQAAQLAGAKLHTLSMPAIGATTVSSEFMNSAVFTTEMRFLTGIMYLFAADAAAGNLTQRIYSYQRTFGGATATRHYIEVNGAGTVTIGKTATITVAPNAGVNRSSLTITDTFGIGSHSVWYLNTANAITAGIGSTRVGAYFHYVFHD